MSSSVEALQMLTGCTIGNQNFFAYDLGKHAYYFGHRTNHGGEPGQALRLALVNRVIDLGSPGELENKICDGEATELEIIQYRRAVEEAVQAILELPEEQLFAKKMVTLLPPPVPGHSRYMVCPHCGEVVVRDKAVSRQGALCCRSCAARANE